LIVTEKTETKISSKKEEKAINNSLIETIKKIEKKEENIPENI
jgi:hypothetical protein